MDSDWAGLWRQGVFCNLVRDVRVNDRDGDDGVDVFLLCRETEFDGGRGDDLGDGKRTTPLVVQFLHGAIRGVVLEI